MSGYFNESNLTNQGNWGEQKVRVPSETADALHTPEGQRAIEIAARKLADKEIATKLKRQKGRIVRALLTSLAAVGLTGAAGIAALREGYVQVDVNANFPTREEIKDLVAGRGPVESSINERSRAHSNERLTISREDEQWAEYFRLQQLVRESYFPNFPTYFNESRIGVDEQIELMLSEGNITQVQAEYLREMQRGIAFGLLSHSITRLDQYYLDFLRDDFEADAGELPGYFLPEEREAIRALIELRARQLSNQPSSTP